MEDHKKSSTKVCVTGGAGYIGSWLVKKLLLKGYTVNATLRNLSDAHKVGLLRSLPQAEEQLRLFEADIYEPAAFQPAINGCEYVIHVAAPMQPQPQLNNITDAVMAGVQSILGFCIKSGTVKKFIYTGSVMSASPVKEDGTSFNDTMDESCWTPLNHSFAHSDDFTSNYTISKTLVEKEVLKYNDKEKYGFDAVTIVCSVVAGDTLFPYLSLSQETVISQLNGNSLCHNNLKFLQEVSGSIPLTHIDDVCEAHIFCIENPLMNGRFVCAQAYPTIAEITAFYQETYPELHTEEIAEEPGKVIRGSSTKLVDMGFEYQYDMKKTLSDTVDCARRFGSLR